MSNVVGEMAPHWLDSHFERDGEAAVIQSIANSREFIAAIRAGLKRKQEAEEQEKRNPGMMTGSPSRQGRAAFLDGFTSPDGNGVGNG